MPSTPPLNWMATGRASGMSTPMVPHEVPVVKDIPAPSRNTSMWQCPERQGAIEQGGQYRHRAELFQGAAEDPGTDQDQNGTQQLLHSFHEHPGGRGTRSRMLRWFMPTATSAARVDAHSITNAASAFPKASATLPGDQWKHLPPVPSQ
jgi:hypothetical protein